jgi:hypothetical protein
VKPHESTAANHLGEKRSGHVAARIDGDDLLAPDDHHRAIAEHEREQIKERDKLEQAIHATDFDHPRQYSLRLSFCRGAACFSGRNHVLPAF